MTWNPNALPDQSGRVIAVTGATAGIGYFAAEQLAGAGARVVLIGRSRAKLVAVERAIREHVPGAQVQSEVLDLASLASIREAVARLSELPALHGIFLNAGPDATQNGVSADGLPLHLAAHSVGNVALSAGVLPMLVRTAHEEGIRTRVVFASTGFVRRIPMSLDDLLRVPRTGVGAYVKAKTALEVYAYELDRQLRADGAPVDSIVTIPGVAVDAKTPQRAGVRDASTPYQRHPLVWLSQGKDSGAWSAVRALTDPEASGGECYGPTGAFRGGPVRIEPAARTARPEEGTAERVMQELERLTGIDQPV